MNWWRNRTKARQAVTVHTVLLVVWGVMVPVSVVTEWIYAIAFTGAASIYANMATHWTGRQAALAEEASPGER
jgi:hypothetical protein